MSDKPKLTVFVDDPETRLKNEARPIAAMELASGNLPAKSASVLPDEQKAGGEVAAHTALPWSVSGDGDHIWIEPADKNANVICDLIGRLHDRDSGETQLTEEDLANAAFIVASCNNTGTPINMLLFCPQCGEQHIDEAKPHVCETCGKSESECICVTFEAWLNPPHKSHRCNNPACNHVWRPADVATNGVKDLKSQGARDGSPQPMKATDIILSDVRQQDMFNALKNLFSAFALEDIRNEGIYSDEQSDALSTAQSILLEMSAGTGLVTIANEAANAQTLVVLLQEHAKCSACDGKGKRQTDCTLCGDSTFDHNCNDEVRQCWKCKGLGYPEAVVVALAQFQKGGAE